MHNLSCCSTPVVFRVACIRCLRPARVSSADAARHQEIRIAGLSFSVKVARNGYTNVQPFVFDNTPTSTVVHVGTRYARRLSCPDGIVIWHRDSTVGLKGRRAETLQIATAARMASSIDYAEVTPPPSSKLKIAAPKCDGISVLRYSDEGKSTPV